jgi:GNAT superfamily N-acetyltransferase
VQGVKSVSAGGLMIEATTSPRGPVLQAFYAGYDQAFVLPNEKEELAGFAECLALNEAPAAEALSRRFGPFAEVVFVAREALRDATVGGANFIAYPLGSQLVLNLNYIFVLPERRRQGYFAPLVRSVAEVARAFFPEASGAPVLMFIEQNDPLRMSLSDYARDTEHSGTDQLDRIRIWAKLGAKVVDHAYVQPALSSRQGADDTLVYSVLNAPGAALDPCLLRDHLQRYFVISVLKGHALASSPEAQQQVDELSARCREGRPIELLDPAPILARYRSATQIKSESACATLRGLIRQAGAG